MVQKCSTNATSEPENASGDWLLCRGCPVIRGVPFFLGVAPKNKGSSGLPEDCGLGSPFNQARGCALVI